MKNETMISVKLPVEMIADIGALCEADGINRSIYIRQALRKTITADKKRAVK